MILTPGQDGLTFGGVEATCVCLLNDGLRKSVKHQKTIFGFVHFLPDSTEEDLLVDILKFYDVPVKHCHKLPFYPCIVLTLSLSYHHICPDQWVPPSFENEIIFQHLMIKDKFFVSDKNICSVAY